MCLSRPRRVVPRLRRVRRTPGRAMSPSSDRVPSAATMARTPVLHGCLAHESLFTERVGPPGRHRVGYRGAAWVTADMPGRRRQAPFCGRGVRRGSADCGSSSCPARVADIGRDICGRQLQAGRSCVSGPSGARCHHGAGRAAGTVESLGSGRTECRADAASTSERERAAGSGLLGVPSAQSISPRPSSQVSVTGWRRAGGR